MEYVKLTHNEAKTGDSDDFYDEIVNSDWFQLLKRYEFSVETGAIKNPAISEALRIAAEEATVKSWGNNSDLT